MKRWFASIAASVVLCGSPLAQAKPVLADYGRLPAIESMALSPSGDRLSYVAVDGDASVVAVRDAGGKPLLTVPAGKAKVRDVEWAGDDHLLIHVTQTLTMSLGDADLYEGGQAFAVNVNTGKRIDVLSKTLSFPALLGDFGTAQVDGRWYGYFGAITPRMTRDGPIYDHGYPDLYRIDLDTGDSLVAARGGEELHQWVVDGAGKVAVHSRYDVQSGRWRLLVGSQAGQEVAAKSAPSGGVALLGLGRTPDTALIQDDTGAAGRLEEWTLTSPGRATELFQGEVVGAPLFDPASKLLIGAAADTDTGAVLFDPRFQARLLGARRAFPKQQMRLVSFDRDFGRLIVFTDGAEDSGAYWLVDIATGKADPLGSAYPNIKPADVAPTRVVHYKAQDGLDIDAVLTLPVGQPAKDLPLIVLPHGGPEAHDKISFDWWAQAFANEGYAVLQPNFRGSDGRGVEFERKGYGEWGRKMQTDLSDGVAALAGQGLIDPKRVCIVGASYGGYAALAGVTLQSGVYRCAASVAGITDLADFKNTMTDRRGSNNINTRHWQAFWGTKDLNEISPARLAGRANAPILLVHGHDDTVVPLAQSETMNRALRRAGKPVQLIVLDGEDHWLSQGKSRLQMLSAIMTFVEKYNPR